MAEEWGDWPDRLLCGVIILLISPRIQRLSGNMEKAANTGLLPLVESPITWGGIGVLIGAIAAVALLCHN